jgi:hypothetical protein
MVTIRALKRQKEPSIAPIFYKLPVSCALSRQRSRVRAPSSPPYIPGDLWSVCPSSDYPQSKPHLLLERVRLHPHLLLGCSLSRLHLDQVRLSVEIQSCLNLWMSARRQLTGSSGRGPTVRRSRAGAQIRVTELPLSPCCRSNFCLVWVFRLASDPS